MDVREKLVELFYDNNVRCDQKIEGLADDVMGIITNVVMVQENIEISDELLKQLKNAPITILREEPTIEVVQEWISVDDRSPEPKENAICINRHGDMMIGTYTEWGWMFPCYFESPTHWTPLPQPPKGE